MLLRIALKFASDNKRLVYPKYPLKIIFSNKTN